MGSTSQLRELMRSLHSRRLRLRGDARLARTPYVAMNPRAGRELHMPYKKRTITYSPAGEKSLKRKVVDIRHELLEWDKMGEGWHYKSAHKFANKHQRSVGAV